MAELERDLRAARLDWPETPELGARVRARLAEPPAGLAWRRPLVVALAIVAVAIAAAFAVPPARTAILRWLGLNHVRVVRVERLPETHKLATADLGRRMTYPAAVRAVGFEPLLPRRPADAIFVARSLDSLRVTFLYGTIAKPRLTLTEFRGFGVTKFVEKLAEPGTKVERVMVEGDPGLWLSGKPHAVMYSRVGSPYNVLMEQPILAGNTLVWERRDGLTVRLEGDLDKDEALRLAKSLR